MEVSNFSGYSVFHDFTTTVGDRLPPEMTQKTFATIDNTPLSWWNILKATSADNDMGEKILVGDDVESAAPPGTCNSDFHYDDAMVLLNGLYLVLGIFYAFFGEWPHLQLHRMHSKIILISQRHIRMKKKNCMVDACE